MNNLKYCPIIMFRLIFCVLKNQRLDSGTGFSICFKYVLMDLFFLLMYISAEGTYNQSLGLINHDVYRFQKSINVLLNVSKIFIRHHCTLKSFTYGEKNEIIIQLWVNQVTRAHHILWRHNIYGGILAHVKHYFS